MFDYVSRIERLTQLMKVEELPAYLVTNPVDLLYLTGCNLSRGKFLITPTEEVLLVDGRYIEGCQKGSFLTVLLDEEKTFKSLVEGVKTLGIDSERTSIDEYIYLETLFKEVAVTTRPLKSLVKLLRAYKDDQELSLLRLAAKMGIQGFEFARSLLKVGIEERTLAWEIESFWRNQGVEGLAFPSIIAFGTNSSMPHYRAGTTQLAQDSIVLMDMGVSLNHYHSDMTRVLFQGTVDKKLLHIRDIVEEAFNRAVDILEPGVSAGELDDAARSYIQAQGYGDYFNHSLGHGIGLEVHEFPTLKQNSLYANIILQPGMVITIEPGIYLPGVGGVRLEDTVAITDSGYENLTNYPKK